LKYTAHVGESSTNLPPSRAVSSHDLHKKTFREHVARTLAPHVHLPVINACENAALHFSNAALLQSNATGSIASVSANR
jgi:hypothetical protein